MFQRKVTSLLAAAVLLLAVTAKPAHAQATADLTWDIVSVKPHRPGDGNTSVNWRPATFSASNVTLKNLIADSYDVKQWLISGLPPWASQHWDVEAKFSEPDMKLLRNLSREQRRDMLAAMLRTTFGLKLHRETKVQPVFELTVLPDGPKFKPAPIPPVNDNGEKPKPQTSFSVNDGLMEGKGTTMENLAANLSYAVERNVLDKTGLNAEYGYNVELRWTPEDRGDTNDNGTGADAPPQFVEAVREQLGLKLTSARAEVPTVVVDSIRQPDTN